MQELLANPAVQAALVPFLLAFVLAWLLHRPALAGLAVAAALLAVSALAMGLSFETLTSTRKLLLVVLAFALPAAWVARGRASGGAAGAVLAAAAGLAALWVVWRILAQKEGAEALAAGAAAAVFIAGLVEMTRRFARDPIEAAAAAMALGLGSGALALLGASALLAQMGIALGAGAGALLLVQMIRGRTDAPAWSLALVAGVAAALVAEVAAFTGSLPWYAALPMLAVPWAATWVPGNAQRPAGVAAVIGSCTALIPVAIAVAIAWFAAPVVS